VVEKLIAGNVAAELHLLQEVAKESGNPAFGCEFHPCSSLACYIAAW